MVSTYIGIPPQLLVPQSNRKQDALRPSIVDQDIDLAPLDGFFE